MILIFVCCSQEGRTAGEIQSVREVLDRLKGATYTLKELQVRPLPEQMILEGVDPTRLESYLTPAEFQVLYRTTTAVVQIELGAIDLIWDRVRFPRNVSLSNLFPSFCLRFRQHLA